jgi:hypothetical protein
MGIHLMPPLYLVAMQKPLKVADFNPAQSEDDCGVTYQYTPPSGWTLALNVNDNVAGRDFVPPLGSPYHKTGCGIRFPNVTIPKGSKIVTAYITFISRESLANTTVNTRLRFENNVNPLVFSTLEDFQARSWLTGLNWDDIGAWVYLSSYQTPELKTLVKAVIGLSGWSSGKAMCVCWDDFEARSVRTSGFKPKRRGRSFDDYSPGSGQGTTLHVEYR